MEHLFARHDVDLYTNSKMLFNKCHTLSLCIHCSLAFFILSVLKKFGSVYFVMQNGTCLGSIICLECIVNFFLLLYRTDHLYFPLQQH